MYGDPTIISIREKIMSENSQRSKNNEFSDLESIRRIAYINFHNKNSRVYEDRRKVFIELNIGFTSFLSFIILYI